MKKALKIFGIILLVLILIITISSFIYINTYYHCDNEALKYLESTSLVKVSKIDNGYLFDNIKNEDIALIFYPGAKVQTEAYSKLLHQISENGIDCFLINMPGRIAFLGKNSASKITNNYNYSSYYISGHSLGGVVASLYVDEHKNDFKGLIFLASYPTVHIPNNLKIISIYGNNDTILSNEKYEESKTLWSNDSKEVVIEGGNHAGFANYGKQKSDGKLQISQDSEQEQTVNEIINFILNN